MKFAGKQARFPKLKKSAWLWPQDFYGPGLRDSNPTLLKMCYTSTVKEGIVGGNEGTLLLDFGRILYHDGDPIYPNYSGPGKNYQDSDFALDYPQGEPFSLSVRVLALMDESGFNDISNTVNMYHLTQYGDSDAPPLASNVPSMYDIEILEDTYLPPAYEIRTKWACVIIDEDPSGHYSPGKKFARSRMLNVAKIRTAKIPDFWRWWEQAGM